VLEDCSQDRANGFLAMFAGYPWPSLGKGAIRLSPRKRAYIKVILGNGHCCCSWERSGGDCCHYAPSMLLSGLGDSTTHGWGLHAGFGQWGELGCLDHLQWVPPCAPRKWRHKSLCGFIFLIPRIWGQYEVPNPAKSISSSITGQEIRPSANWTLDSCVAASTIQPCTQTRPRFRV
jgi:hypothetical protein